MPHSGQPESAIQKPVDVLSTALRLLTHLSEGNRSLNHAGRLVKNLQRQIETLQDLDESNREIDLLIREANDFEALAEEQERTIEDLESGLKNQVADIAEAIQQLLDSSPTRCCGPDCKAYVTLFARRVASPWAAPERSAPLRFSYRQFHVLHARRRPTVNLTPTRPVEVLSESCSLTIPLPALNFK
jgi:hypothetical protein